MEDQIVSVFWGMFFGSFLGVVIGNIIIGFLFGRKTKETEVRTFGDYPPFI